MQPVDIILLVLFVPGIIHGAVKGIIIQVVSLLSVFAGAIVAGRFAPDLTPVVMLQLGSDERVTYILCFVVLFLATALIMALFGRLVTKLFKIATLGWLNRLLGAVFAIFTTALVLGLLISAFEGLNTSWELVSPEKLEGLKVYPVLRDFSSTILPQLKIFFSQWVNV